MGIWKHNIDPLDSLVSFESLSFTASNAAIEVDVSDCSFLPVCQTIDGHQQSISALKARLVTSNAPIEGSFNVSDSLILKTSNAHIESKIRMENADGHRPTRVEMKTSNALVFCCVSF